MAAALEHIVFFSFSLQPLHLSASPAAGNGRQGRPRGSIIRSSLASQRLLLSSDLDLQKSITDVRKTLHRCRKSSREMIATFDNLKRLCIDHYFKEEIESGMGACMELVHSDDLLDATISFRFMREAGHDVSADDVLRRFTNSAGELSHSLSKDIVGLLSLHDMSHLDIGEEASLHKAKEFSTKNLASAITNLEPGLATYVRHSLDHPYHLSLMQFKARHHLSYLQSLRNGVVTSGVPLAFVHILFLLGHRHAARSDAAELADHIPPAISSAAKILRLMENPTGDAEEHMQSLIAMEWQKLNRECFSQRTFSGSFSQVCFNAARMVSVMYSYDKEQRLPVLEDYMRMLLI